MFLHNKYPVKTIDLNLIIEPKFPEIMIWVNIFYFYYFLLDLTHKYHYIILFIYLIKILYVRKKEYFNR